MIVGELIISGWKDCVIIVKRYLPLRITFTESIDIARECVIKDRVRGDLRLRKENMRPKLRVNIMGCGKGIKLNIMLSIYGFGVDDLTKADVRCAKESLNGSNWQILKIINIREILRTICICATVVILFLIKHICHLIKKYKKAT